MANTTNTQRLLTEAQNTLTLGNRLLTNLGTIGGYAALYGMKDKEIVNRNALYLFLFALQLFVDWDTEIYPLEVCSFQRIMSKAQQIYKNSGCTETDLDIESEADDIDSDNIFGGDADIEGTTTVTQAGAVRGIALQIVVTAGAQLEPGDTSYVIPYTNIVYGTIEVKMPQGNLPAGLTDQISAEPIYSGTGATINFTNLDGSTNIGVQEGMVIMITGLRYSSAVSSGISSTNSLPPIDILGSELDVDGAFLDPAYAGIDLLVFANSIPRYLDLGTEYTINAAGGFRILIGCSPSDRFIATPK